MNASAADANGSAPTLELQEFALRSPGAAWSAPLRLRSNASRLALVGDWNPLFQALSARAEIASGSATVLGCALESAIARGVVGFAACDPPLPGSFSVKEYLQHAARLTHGSATRSVHDAKRALERYGLTELAKYKLARLVLHQRRALGIALATLTMPAVICLETPLRGLDAPSADYIARLCLEAARHGRLIISADLPHSPSPERSLLDACEDVCVLERGVLVAQGAPSSVFAPNSRYALRVTGEPLAPFLDSLRKLGMQVVVGADAGCFRIELPQAGGETADLLLDTALDHGVVVVELEPLFTP